MSEEQVTHDIRQNGTLLLQGSESCKVVFNNISGQNFVNQPAWRTTTHAEYLAMLASELKVSFSAGDEFTLHVVGDPNPSRTYTLAEDMPSTERQG